MAQEKGWEEIEEGWEREVKPPVHRGAGQLPNNHYIRQLVNIELRPYFGKTVTEYSLKEIEKKVNSILYKLSEDGWIIGNNYGSPIHEIELKARFTDAGHLLPGTVEIHC